LGKTLLETAPANWEAWATFYRNEPPLAWRSRFYPLDVSGQAMVTDVVARVHPDVVIHVASVGGVDEAQRDPVRVREVNVNGTQVVGRACARRGVRFVFISSNAVFDGQHPPYTEDAPLHAVNQYGVLKIEAETWIRQGGVPSPLIIRPILMYGWPLAGGRDNVVTRWLSRLERGQSVEVAEDVYSMPLYVDNCAEAIWSAVQQRRVGTYHLAGADRVSLVEFARATARLFDCDEQLVMSVPSAHFTTLAPRPLDTSFVTVKMERELGVRPLGILEGLRIMQRARAAVKS